LSMPIHFEGKTVGCINITSFQKNAFDEEEIKLLEVVAQQIEVAINNAQQAGALRESEERFRALVENSSDAIVINVGTKRVFVNKAFLTIHGLDDMSQALGNSLDQFVLSKDVQLVSERTLARQRGEAVPAIYEYRIRRPDGEERTVETSAAAITYKGQPAALAVIRDVSERKRMEEELIKAQKLESVGVLAGGIAHDFNNLLTAILGNISLARMYADPKDKMFERLTEAEKVSLRAKDLTQQLLTFAKGGAPVKRVTYIGELIKDSASFAVRGSNVRCEFSIPDDPSTSSGQAPSTSSGQAPSTGASTELGEGSGQALWWVEVDEGQMSQVINNVVINAQQAMPEGGIIKVRAENMTVGAGFKPAPTIEDGKYVKITIEDRGIGIPKEHLPKIFDPYFTTKQKGSGLGLATAYSIIKKHDGFITVESKVGVGTTFYIYLPASQKEILRKEEGEKLLVGKGKILVMDDEKVVREVAGNMLDILGHEVEFASDGAEAIESYKIARESGQPFDVVILDLTVPGGMGGKEAIRKLLEIDPGVKAIVSSGYSNDPVMAEFRGYGFRGVIAKPYKIKELSEVLYNVINGNE